MNPVSLRSYPRAILHFDGDSFFASVEQALNHELRGRPVVTGGERGAATSVSYEAKARGVHRGMTLREIKRVCPEVAIVASDYTSYSIFARRMYSIVREYTPDVEEYSIDECFADITGLRSKYRMSYERIALRIKAHLENDLGVTFGVGLAPNKTMAKVASKAHKPAGFTPIPGREIHTFLETLSVGSIWGLGGSMSLYLEKLGIKTALQFALRDEYWLRENKISKPYQEIWHELNGRFVKQLSIHEREEIGSIMKTHTFVPSRDREVVYSHLAKNVEAVCIKARRHNVKGKIASFYLKTQTFTYMGLSLDFSIPVADPRVMLELVQKHFDRVFEPGVEYRAAGFTLHSILADHAVTDDLFGLSTLIKEKATVLTALDAINQKYGRNTLHFGSSFAALHEVPRKSSLVKRKKFILDIDQRKKSLNIPYLGIAR